MKIMMRDVTSRALFDFARARVAMRECDFTRIDVTKRDRVCCAGVLPCGSYTNFSSSPFHVLSRVAQWDSVPRIVYACCSRLF